MALLNDQNIVALFMPMGPQIVMSGADGDVSGVHLWKFSRSMFCQLVFFFVFLIKWISLDSVSLLQNQSGITQGIRHIVFDHII